MNGGATDTESALALHHSWPSSFLARVVDKTKTLNVGIRPAGIDVCHFRERRAVSFELCLVFFGTYTVM